MNGLLWTVALLLVGIPLVSEASPAESTGRDDACTGTDVRIVSYHFVVDGTTYERLQEHVRPGDNFTVLFVLAACGRESAEQALTFTLPPCDSLLGSLPLRGLQSLNSSNVTDDAEAPLVRDVRDAMGCGGRAKLPGLILLALGTTVGSVAIVDAVCFFRQRKK